jgi:HlyD family secretion protein
VISSPTRDVSGGTVLLTMADLQLVQVRTLVDETDIGKIAPEQRATITVEAYPNRPFEGTVLKIEPQALTEQNVTTFPVLVRIDNREGLLRPGMNAEVEIHIGERDDVLAVPNAALRTARDAGSAAQVLGLSADAVQQVVAQGRARNGRDSATPSSGSGSAGDSTRSSPARGIMTAAPADSGARIASGSADRQRFRAGGRGMMRRGGRGGTGTDSGGARSSAGPNGLFGGRYIVFVRRGGQTVPVWVRTGLTDLDYSEVVSGLAAGDSVLLLPSASLVQAREQQQQMINQRTRNGMGGGAPVTRPR